MSRPDWFGFFLQIAEVAAKRSTCARRHVGCVLFDREFNIMTVAYNGVPPGSSHCRGGEPCPGHDAPSGSALNQCDAIHAEQNAVARCRDPRQIYGAAVTTAPCDSCTKLLLATTCQVIVAGSDYADSGKDRWMRAGRKWYVTHTRD